MKKQLLTIGTLILSLGQIIAQSPTLSLVGSSPSLAKGTINTEVLTEIIQKKQEEVKQRVFRNTIVKQFNYGDYTKNLKNFTTYHYLYNVMDILTSGKNKTAMTKSVTESSTEFSCVFGLALFIQKNIPPTTNTKSIGAMSMHNNIIEGAQVEYFDNRIILSDKVKDFNLLIDLCYDVILTNKALQTSFQFKDNLSDKDFKTWFKNDNRYFIDSSAAIGDERTHLIESRTEVETELTELSTFVDATSKNITQITKSLNDLKSLGNTNLNSDIAKTLNSLASYSGAELKAKILQLNTDFSTLLDSSHQATITSAANLIGANYDNFKELVYFYSGLQKSNFKDFTLTKDQYYAMKYLITKFLNVAKNQYPNDVIATVIDFLLENTIVEYADNESGILKDEKSTTSDDKGYLTINVESLISAIDDKFSPTTKKGLGVYIQPFFSIGTNYASFTNSNFLTTDATGVPQTLYNLYFASEKIGIKWKLWNWKYTHSYSEGQSFKYFNQSNVINPWAWHNNTNRFPKKIGGKWNPLNWRKCWNPDRYWKRPQPQPLLSDVHLLVYGSGLLYNIANLKSNDKFNYAIAGTGLGFTFFNGLSVNLGFACPYTDNSFQSENVFFNLGFDIPIVTYIGALTKKN